MQTYQIHFIRHALTKGNLEGRYIGHTDEELCPEGIKQLEETIENYGPYPAVDAVFSSPLKRCVDTSKIIYPEKEPIIMNDLIEYDFGEFENKTAEELQKGEDFAEWLSGTNPNKAAPFGDSQVRFNFRICNCFEKIVDSVLGSGAKSVAIITHGGVISSLMQTYALPEAPVHEWLTPNCCGYTVRVDPSIWLRGMKVEAIAECPQPPEEFKHELWDVYDPEMDEYDVAYWENDDNFPDDANKI